MPDNVHTHTASRLNLSQASDAMVVRKGLSTGATASSVPTAAIGKANYPVVNPIAKQREQAKPKRVQMRSITAPVIGDAIVEFCNQHGDVLTNLRLQKLLYYAQAWYLALHDQRLFKDSIVAGVNGPVQPEVAKQFSKYGSKPIQSPSAQWLIPKGVHQHIAELMEAYGNLSAFDLERLVMSEQPWRAAREGIAIDDPQTPQISTANMKRFYRARLNDKTESRKQN